MDLSRVQANSNTSQPRIIGRILGHCNIYGPLSSRFQFWSQLSCKTVQKKKIDGLGFNLKTTLDKAHDNCAKKVTRGSSSHHHVILYNQFWNNSAAYRQADLMVGRVRCSVGKVIWITELKVFEFSISLDFGWYNFCFGGDWNGENTREPKLVQKCRLLAYSTDPSLVFYGLPPV